MAVKKVNNAFSIRAFGRSSFFKAPKFEAAEKGGVVLTGEALHGDNAGNRYPAMFLDNKAAFEEFMQACAGILKVYKAGGIKFQEDAIEEKPAKAEKPAEAPKPSKSPSKAAKATKATEPKAEAEKPAEAKSAGLDDLAAIMVKMMADNQKIMQALLAKK